MPKITFLGAGSTVFAKNILGDTLLTESLRDSHIALYDIDPERLSDSKRMMDNLNGSINAGRARITAHLGKGNRRRAFEGASYVINAVQIGGYKPSTVIDFEIPRKYKLRQTIADTLGIGGIFRGLRTAPVMREVAADMADVCPDAWFLNYVNPMAIVTGTLLRSGVKTVGLCHSVQGCASWLLRELGMREQVTSLQWRIAGINHQAWLLEITDGGRDLYPEIKRRAERGLERILKKGGGRKCAEQHRRLREKGVAFEDLPLELRLCHDMVRLEMMLQFGYYITESSEHCAEYLPYWIKRTHPELIDRYNIPLDEYPRRCVRQIKGWKKRREEIVGNKPLTHQRGVEYGSYILEAMETDVPARIGGNVLNTGLIPNLPSRAIVEVACLVDRNGVQPCYHGDLPETCAALNRTNINVQLLTLEAAFTRKLECVYQAAMLDPHTASELSIDEIRNLCDDLIAAHGRMLPAFRR